MKENKNHSPLYKSASFLLMLFILFIFIILIKGCGDGSAKKISTVEPIVTPAKYKLNISTNEPGSAIYIDGIYTGKVTPSEITVSAVGEYTVGIGLIDSKTYLKKIVNVVSNTEPLFVVLDDNDLQTAKTWKSLFIGVNKVSKGVDSCVSEYSSQELDLGFDFFKWSFQEHVEDYSYNTTKWLFDRRDIDNETIILSDENLITPNIIDNYLSDINKGDYDLIVTFFRGGAGSKNNCFIGDFIGIAWFDVTELNSDASYYTIRYYDDVAAAINSSKQNDPGMFIHEWLHTTAEMFYPNRGQTVPNSDGGVVHAAGKYNYSLPWMTWYKDLISGQVKKGDQYIGIGPEALLACTVRESALNICKE